MLNLSANEFTIMIESGSTAFDLMKGTELSVNNADAGIIGLGVMGQGLALNMDDHGLNLAIYGLVQTRMDDFMNSHPSRNVQICSSIEQLVKCLKPPRLVLIEEAAGSTVDEIIDALTLVLEKGDIVMDLGNSFFLDSERRAREVQSKGFRFLGVGVSGGPQGARMGPSLMCGGDPMAYNVVKPIFKALAAKSNRGDPCIGFVGPRGAGHYVKMVHNSMEYGDMQITAEVFDILRQVIGLTPDKIGSLFSYWNKGPLESLLLTISSKILNTTDPETGDFMVDLICDNADDSGTGRWTCKEAQDLGVSMPTLTAAVEARLLSSMKKQRDHARQIFKKDKITYKGDKDKLIDDLRSGMYASRICVAAQGMILLGVASEKYEYHFDLSALTRIWQGGSIIQSKLLEKIHEAFAKDTALTNLINRPEIARTIKDMEDPWRRAVNTALNMCTPCPAMGASLFWYDSLRSDRLPADLIQAQRNFFGSHPLERESGEGYCQIDWRGK